MTVKNLGVWMDYSNADLIDVDTEKNNQTIKSDFTFDVRGETLSRRGHYVLYSTLSIKDF